MKEATYRDLRDRLHYDARFKMVVDQMYAIMMSHKIAPYELRDAAYMASIEFAYRNTEPRDIQRRFEEGDKSLAELMQIMQGKDVIPDSIRKKVSKGEPEQ